MSRPPRRIEDLLREAAPRVLAALARRFRENFSDCEDAVQEALLAASTQWPQQGTPENPVGWLIHVASLRMIDQVRSEAARRRREGLAATEAKVRESPVAHPAADRDDWLMGVDGGDRLVAPDHDDRLVTADSDDRLVPADHDDTLALMFMCAHPSLTPASAIALTLRAVCGLSTAQIARAFLVPEATAAQRISRAKQSIRASGVSFAMPTSSSESAVRLRSVLRVLYLVFNEGYLTGSGASLTRGELSAEAIRLTRSIRPALPDDPELAGLLALMLLTEARRPARTDAHGELVPLAEQDRSLWRGDLIAEGLALIADALSKGAVGEYQLQAAIAAAHDRAVRSQDTDWREILGLYELLERVTRNPMVALNRAIAAAMAGGPAAGLALLEELAEPLAGHHRLHATRAHLLEMAGQADAAIAEYQTAASRTTSLPEQHYLTKQAARLRQMQAARRG